MSALRQALFSFQQSRYLTWQLAGWGSFALLHTSVEALKQTNSSTPFFVFAGIILVKKTAIIPDKITPPIIRITVTGCPKNTDTISSV